MDIVQRRWLDWPEDEHANDPPALRARIARLEQALHQVRNSFATPHQVAIIDAALARPEWSTPVPRRVRKIEGSFQHTGTLVAEFHNTAGDPRIVLEFDAPLAGLLHIYRPDQVEVVGKDA